MKYIFCQPAVLKFQWQLDVALNSLKRNGVAMNDVVLLFTKHSPKVPKYLANKYGVETHVYIDQREDKGYIPSVRPYLWYRYLSENSKREKETYCYLDSDTLLLKPLDLPEYRADCWLCSDCNGYLNLNYIRQCESGPDILQKMAEIVNVTVESLETINLNSGGAQWIICDPTAKYWEKVYNDSNSLYQYFQTVDSNIQKWTAEMWSQLWNMMYFNIGPMVTDSLSFCWATDPIRKWNESTFYHDAGATEKTPDLFQKRVYTKKSPFDDDLSFVTSEKCSYNYVQAIKGVQ